MSADARLTRVRFVDLPGRHGIYYKTTGLLELSKSASPKDLAVVLADVARVLAGSPALHSQRVRHLSAVK